MDFSRLDHKDLREIVYSNIGSFTYRENKDELVKLATQQYVQAVSNNYVGYVLKAPVVALDRSVRFPQNSTNKYTKEQIMKLDDNYLPIFLSLYQVSQVPEARRIIYKILDLQGFINKPILVQPFFVPNPTVQVVPSYNVQPVVINTQPVVVNTQPIVAKVQEQIIPKQPTLVPTGQTSVSQGYNLNEQVIPINLSPYDSTNYPRPTPGSIIISTSNKKKTLSSNSDEAFIELASILVKEFDNTLIPNIDIAFPIIFAIPSESQIKRRSFINNYFAKYKLSNNKNFTSISTHDVQLLIKLYDELFFNNKLEKLLGNSGNLTVEFSKATSTAGTCSKSGCNITIQVAPKLLEGLFLNPAVKQYMSNGIACTNRLECLQLTIEHELVHALMQLTPEVGKHKRADPNGKVYSAHGELFMGLVRAYFGHTGHKHSLGLEKEEGLEVLHSNNLRIGERVFYVDKQKEKQYGNILKLGPKRAVVRFEDTHKEYYVYYSSLRRA